MTLPEFLLNLACLLVGEGSGPAGERAKQKKQKCFSSHKERFAAFKPRQIWVCFTQQVLCRNSQSLRIFVYCSENANGNSQFGFRTADQTTGGAVRGAGVTSFGMRVAIVIATKSSKAPRYHGAPGKFHPCAGSMK